jgi:hypothetical protein
MAMALAVGLQSRPLPFRHASSTPVASAIDSTLAVDALKVGERLEPRVFPAPVRDRLPPAPLSWAFGIEGHTDEHSASGPIVGEHHTPWDLIPIVKHVPRMERGDPPRT